MNPTTLKSWLQRGELQKLEHVVLEGRGARLLGEHSPDLKTRVFLKGLPNYLTKIAHVHDAVARGSLAETQRFIAEESKKKLAIAKDSAGTPLLHKAVYYDQQDILEWLVHNYPITVQQKDREGRTALHYCAACKDSDTIWDVLIENDCDASICDKKGNPAAYYLEHSSELELPETESMSRRKTTSSKECLDFKPSNIRIWIHNRDLSKLQQVLWEGHGNKLRRETSNNTRVKRFFEAVPFIMGTIKDVHIATINNDLDGLRKKIDATSPIVFCGKDSNGLNVLHKAAGLGYTEIAREILAKCPVVVEAQDNDGRTPLHYAAAAKDDGTLYNLLTEYGADESKLDQRQKAPAFYNNRPSDIDQSLLSVIPEAPRVAGTCYPKHWDWRILDAEEVISRGMKKVNSVDIDSAFGSAESASKHTSRSMEQIKNIKDDHQKDEQENSKEAETVEDTEITKDGKEAENAEDTEKVENTDNPKNEENAEDTEHIENTENTENAEHTEHAENAGNPEESKESENESKNKEEETAEETKDEDMEDRSSDDDVVTGPVIENTEENDNLEHEVEEKKPEEAENEDKPEANDKDESSIKPEESGTTEEVTEQEEDNKQEESKEEENKEEENKEEENKEEENKEEESKTEQEERKEPSTGDSGVDDPANDEDQVIVGEHEELPKAELNEGSMTADPEIEKLLETGNMEQLAGLVLNGEGRRLVGRHSGNPELQAFIDRVPSYMGKIHAVHMAAREGNLRDLQSALDRRKFAVARDGSSPHGATPLHVAVVFGNTTVIRYLAGRFPETAHAIDYDGRTPLHYAATLADNGHYYNLLLHLGANPLVQDNLGQTADSYKQQEQSEFSHKSLLRDFGANENLAEEMLMDKVPGGDTVSARRDITEQETLATLERCFRLLIGIKHGMTPKSAGNSGTLVGRCLKRPTFDRIKHRVTRMDHNLFDVIWPALKKYGNSNYNSKASSAYSIVSNADEDECQSIVAPDCESYIVFNEFFDPLIRDIHCVSASGDLPDHPLPRFFYTDDENGEESPDTVDEVTVSAIEAYDLDPPAKYVQAAVIECSRNLENYTFPLTLTVNQLEAVEREITSELMSQEISGMMAEGSSEDEPGTYFTLSEILDQPSPIRAQLAASGLLLPITDFEAHNDRRLHGRHWPYGRGVYVTSAGDLAAWVNVQDHLRIVCRTNDNRPALIGRAYVRLAKVMVTLDERLIFKRDQKLGFLSARPHAIGNTLRFSVIIKLPVLSKEFDNLKHLCVVRGLSIRETARRDTVRIGNHQSLSITEIQTLQDFSRAVLNILTLEKELTINNSIKIASLLAGIFHEKQIDIPIFREEEGRYLASSLGDPLIKGLTEVANNRPKDPVTYLATYLYNFANKTKSSPQEEEPNVLIIPDRPEENLENVENENGDEDAGYPQSPGSDVPESAFSNPNRDEHGQSVVHFAAIRGYAKDGLFHLLQESQVNVGFRDELYRTARDVAELANVRENADEIDRFVAYLAARGETEKLVELLLEGYDHILDVEDEGVNIVDIAVERGREATVQFLQSIPNYVTQREEVHHEIRTGNVSRVKELLNKNSGGGKLLAMGKNSMSRCALHIAVLRENEEMVKYIAKTFPETLRIGDNLERTALHYAMGLASVEGLSNILIKAGAKRTTKDLKSRQPSYYFMNKSDIERLQEEEEGLVK